jgi:hypothetical protein
VLGEILEALGRHLAADGPAGADYARAIPRGEIRTYGDIASSLRASGALN